jgi:hypothetical protein
LRHYCKDVCEPEECGAREAPCEFPALALGEETPSGVSNGQRDKDVLGSQLSKRVDDARTERNRVSS